MKQLLEKYKPKIPLIITTLLTIVSFYYMLKSMARVTSAISTRLLKKEYQFFPSIFGYTNDIGYTELIIIGSVSILAFLLSTRVKFYMKPIRKLFMFLIPLFYFLFSLIGIGMAKIRIYVFPFFEDKMSMVLKEQSTLSKLLFEEFEGFYTLITLLPVIVIVFLCMFIFQKFLAYQELFIESFNEFEIKGEKLRKFSNLETKSELPDVLLGINTITKEQVVLPGGDRALHTLIVGPVGAGKSAAIALVTINQDLHYIAQYINRFKDIVENEDYLTDGTIENEFSGISIIDPSNDLCQKVYDLCKAHNIPEDMIYYIDPTNPKTKSINIMKGPASKVAEELTQVLADLSDNGGAGNPFFMQAQRSHLKNYIYLLKLHDKDKADTWLFDDLIEMYNDTNLVHKMHNKLKVQIEEMSATFIDEKDVTSEAYIEKRDERNFLKNLINLDAWFSNNIVPVMEKMPGGMVRKVYNEKNEIQYEDLQERDIKGLINVLSDLATNTYVNRVLFGHSDFDFDEHMEKGGILLVNTAKGELVEMSSIIGKIVLVKLQSAAFRRKPNVTPYHHIYVDEAPEYLYQSFKSFPAQCRKYKVIITTLQQTIAQLAGPFGEPYMDTLIGTMRNRFVFGDLPAYDAKYFSELFGDKFEFEESETEQAVSPLQDNPVSRSGSTYTRVDKSNMSLSQMVYQDAFTFAAKIVVKNKPIPVQQIKADFVPREEFEIAKVLVLDEAAEFYINYNRNQTEDNEVSMIDMEILVEEHTQIELTAPEDNTVRTNDFLSQVDRVKSDVVDMPTEQIIKYDNIEDKVEKEVPVIDFRAYKAINDMNQAFTKKADSPSDDQTERVNPFFIPKREVEIIEDTALNKEELVNPFFKVKSEAVEGDNKLSDSFESTEIVQENLDFIEELQGKISEEFDNSESEKTAADLFRKR